MARLPARATFVALLLVLVSQARPSFAQVWNVCPYPAGSPRQLSSIVPDGSGNFIFLWDDKRNYPSTNFDVYARRMTDPGVSVAGWPDAGKPVLVAPDEQQAFGVSDGQGGVVMAVNNVHFNGFGQPFSINLLVHRFDSNGNPAPGWPAFGIPLTTTPVGQLGSTIISDGMGGAYVGWFDGDAVNSFIQHVLPNGTIAAGWPASGRPLGQNSVIGALVLDGTGGVFVTWAGDNPSGGHLVRVLRFLPSGDVAPGWPAEGVRACSNNIDQDTPQGVADGAGGLILCWRDLRADPRQEYATHLTGAGARVAGWPSDGKQISRAVNFVDIVLVASDDAGGAFIAWTDFGADFYQYEWDIYLERIQSNGDLAPGWPVGGRNICSAPGPQDLTSIAADGVHGVYLGWADNRNNPDVDPYGQHITGSGAVAPTWPLNGRLLVQGSGSEPYGCQVVADSQGGAVFGWYTQLLSGFAPYPLEAVHFPASPPLIDAGFKMEPDHLKLDEKNMDKIVRGHITLPLPSRATDVDVASITLNGVLHVLPDAPVEIHDHHGDSPDELIVQFSRSSLALLLGPGDHLSVEVRGLAAGQEFAGFNEVKVKQGKIRHPRLADAVSVGQVVTIQYDVTDAELAPTVTLLHTVDDGANWIVDATNVPNTGSAMWVAPEAPADHVRLAIVEVEDASDPTGTVTGVLGLSDDFTVGAVLDVADALGAVQFAPVAPSPSAGEARLAFSLPHAARVTLQVFDASGRLVRTIASGDAPAGRSEFRWRGESDRGGRATAGLYFARLHSGDTEIVRRIVWTP